MPSLVLFPPHRRQRERPCQRPPSSCACVRVSVSGRSVSADHGHAFVLHGLAFASQVARREALSCGCRLSKSRMLISRSNSNYEVRSAPFLFLGSLSISIASFITLPYCSSQALYFHLPTWKPARNVLNVPDFLHVTQI